MSTSILSWCPRAAIFLTITVINAIYAEKLHIPEDLLPVDRLNGISRTDRGIQIMGTNFSILQKIYSKFIRQKLL